MGRHVNHAWFCVAPHCTERLGERANHVSAKNHVTPGHCAFSNRVLLARVNFGKCKKHSHASCKSALPAPTELHPMKSECIAPWFTDLFGVEKRGDAGERGGGGTPHKVSDDTLLLVTLLTPLVMDYIRLTSSIKWQTFYTARARTHTPFSDYTLCNEFPKKCRTILERKKEMEREQKRNMSKRK